MTSPQAEPTHVRRLVAVAVLLICIIAALVFRLVDLSVIKRHFLQNQWSQRAIREIVLPAYRGMITDRNGQPLAISTPVYAAWVDPTKVVLTQAQLISLSQFLSLEPSEIQDQLEKFKHKQFLYLKRDLSPTLATDLENLNIKGLFLERQYRRFYPEGESSSQLIGITNIDDIGQEGLELEYNSWLSGSPGLKKVIQDRYGNEVSSLGTLREPVPGHNLTLSIDNRLQYIAYHELDEGLKYFGAQSGSIVILDVKTGEILAMANAPSFNPNIRPKSESGIYRNRAVTDLFEPGSTMKTIAMATALSSGRYTPNSLVDTNPGYWFVDGKKVDDLDDGNNNGVITLTRVLEVSSNVGISKTILSLPHSNFLNMIHSFGFVQPTGIGFPGESDGYIATNADHSAFVLATIAFGYGISVNLLQLAHTYQTIANDGQETPLSLFMVNTPPQTKQVISPKVALELRGMLETVLDKHGGTAVAARVPNYIISGKTGTTRILGPHGYELNHHNAVFVGMAPATNPRLVIAVELHDPTKKAYFGGDVAGPIFAKVMGDALRILNVPPDNTAAT
ncbi:MAG TPA: penicillin-binding protein 2 [Gammaproteobacteria bacterium]|nr:penicillin-binding protein 2 [Gammaproteobacteria bacterium]